IDVIAHMARLPSGRRVVLEVATVDGIHEGQPVLTPLFRFRPRLGTHGLFESTGVVPELAIQFADVGEDFPEGLFAPGPDGGTFEVGAGEGG
ncbi:MAG TPA: hypothetical protein VK977_04265, partial [Actinomycetota bacterium]|nr:hypothetical protein [Actinomycetota bacterium]